jgi:hypothetical protein
VVQELFASGEFASRFELLARVGDAETVVYLAFDRRRSEKVALKFIDVPAQEPLRVALLSSLRAALRVRSPFVVSTYEVISAANTICVVLEFIPGKTLTQLCSSNEQLPFDEVVSILQSIVRGLNDIHRCGLVHRDLKRENVMVTDAGVVKIVDLGLLSVAQVPTVGVDAQTWVSTAEWIVGTPAYLPPEYFKLGAFDQRSDLYALGCLAYELLTGECPFPQRSFLDLVHSKLHGRFPSLAKRRPDCPVSLAGWVVHLLSVEPSGRYVDAVACHSALSIDGNKRTEDLVRAPDYGSRWRGLLERFATFCDRRRAPIWLVNLNEELLGKTDQRLARTGVLCAAFLVSCILIGGLLAEFGGENQPRVVSDPAANAGLSPLPATSPLWSRVSLFSDTVANRVLLERIVIADQSGTWIRLSTGETALPLDTASRETELEVVTATWPKQRICRKVVQRTDEDCLVTSDQELRHPIPDGAGGVFYLQASENEGWEAWHRGRVGLRQMSALHRPISALGTLDVNTLVLASPGPKGSEKTLLFLSSGVGTETAVAEVSLPRIERLLISPSPTGHPRN